MDSDNQRESFQPTSGRIMGVLAVLLGATMVVLGTVSGAGLSWGLVAFGVFVMALAWTAMLRPGVALEADALVLRNLVSTVRVPLAAVEQVAVRQVLVVRAGEQRYTSPAVGRSRRTIRRDDRRPHAEAAVDLARLAQESYGLFVEQRIRSRAEDARAVLGIRLSSPEQVALAERAERRLAWPEIAVLSGSFVVCVLAVVL